MRYRHWLLTINYKNQTVLTNQEMVELINKSNDVVYYVFQLEKGKYKGTSHHQLFISYKNAKEHSTMINKFKGFHITKVKETPHKAAAYCKKEEMRLSEPIEWGSLPQQGQRKDLEKIYDMIKDGASDAEIRETYPSQYMRLFRSFEKIRQDLKFEQFSATFRKLEVTYVYGTPGANKTRHVFDKYGYGNVFRITDKKHPFDNYQGEDVIVFEEFRSSFTFDEILNYLDGYPLLLPARYNQKVACYTKVYLLTNLPFEKQYELKQQNDLESYKAFCRRINYVDYFFKTENDEKKVIRYNGTYDYLKKNKLQNYIKTSEKKYLERYAKNTFVLPSIESSWFDDEDYLEYYTDLSKHSYIDADECNIIKPRSNLDDLDFSLEDITFEDLIG
jgi:hypothetical protein